MIFVSANSDDVDLVLRPTDDDDVSFCEPPSTRQKERRIIQQVRAKIQREAGRRQTDRQRDDRTAGRTP